MVKAANRWRCERLVAQACVLLAFLPIPTFTGQACEAAFADETQTDTSAGKPAGTSTQPQVDAKGRASNGEQEEDYYPLVSLDVTQATTDSRAEVWKPGQSASGDRPVLEITGLAPLPDGKLAVAIRKGEVWILDGLAANLPEKIRYRRFASALHDPMGLLLAEDGALLTVQRGELTALRDRDGDGTADEYETVASGWGLTGHYHEYAYGPKRDAKGNLWLTLNIGLGLSGEQFARTVTDPTLGYRQGKWRGWGMAVTPEGMLVPMCGGMRSPSGLGPNLRGDMFYTDQQGNWVPTNSLHHLRPGVFFHHAEALASMNLPGSPIRGVKGVPDGAPYPVALKQFPQLRPPAVWFPYKKMGQSATDIAVDASGGKFGPFAGQLFVGEFTQAAIQRVFLEQVGGEYQGACFPFRQGLASAVVRLAQAEDGSLFAGLTNRGWSSLGTASHGLQRVVWSGKTPLEIVEMKARPDGFELVFTQPIDPASASDPKSYRLSSYTYLYHATYGSDEIDARELAITAAQVAPDHRSVRLKAAGLRPFYVHELTAAGVRNAAGQKLLHPEAYYTLNRIPAE